jgi:hypothetical protein
MIHIWRVRNVYTAASYLKYATTRATRARVQCTANIYLDFAILDIKIINSTFSDSRPSSDGFQILSVDIRFATVFIMMRIYDT